MSITFRCDCGSPLEFPDNLAGQTVRCIACGRDVRVPVSPLDRPCPYCAAPIPSSASTCPACRQPLGAAKAPAAPEPPRIRTAPAAESGRYIPWEDSSAGLFGGYWKTWAGSQFGMDAFWSRVPWEGGFGAPLKYVLFTMAHFLVLGMFCIVPFVLFMLVGVASSPGDRAPEAGAVLAMIVVGIPVFVGFALLGTFLAAAIYHLVLRLLGGVGTYEATYRAVAYSYGTQFWAVIPYLGGLVQTVFLLIALIHGFSHAHQVSKGKAALAFLLPAAFCCCLAAGGIFLLFFSVARHAH